MSVWFCVFASVCVLMCICVTMFVCGYIFVCVTTVWVFTTFIFVCVYIRLSLCMFTSVCVYFCVYICLVVICLFLLCSPVYTCSSFHVCLNMCVCLCVLVCVYVFVYRFMFVCVSRSCKQPEAIIFDQFWNLFCGVSWPHSVRPRPLTVSSFLVSYWDTSSSSSESSRMKSLKPLFCHFLSSILKFLLGSPRVVLVGFCRGAALDPWDRTVMQIQLNLLVTLVCV